MIIFDTISNVNDYLKIETQHPLIDIRRYEDILPLVPIKKPVIFNFYKISVINNFNGTMGLGNKSFSGKNGVIYFVAPEQKYHCTSTNPWIGYQILIHPDIFLKNFSGKNINYYSFFAYDFSESLLLTSKENKTVNLLLHEAWSELNTKNDNYSISIVLSYLDTLLNLASRYYDRQFTSRSKNNNQILQDFYKLLKTHYNDTSKANNLASVALFADKLHLTANYLGDIIKIQTGKTASSIIHSHIIDESKLMLTSTAKTILEISLILGFEYPTYFSRLFKKKTNTSPSSYRNSVKSI